MNLSRTPWLAASMVLAVAVVAALAYWDQQREAALALSDFAQEQSTLATAAAAGLSVRLEAARREPLPPASLLSPLERVERGGQRLLLLLPPHAQAFVSSDGREVVAEELRAPLEAGRHTARLTQAEAARIGLPPRTAMAGLAAVNDAVLGRYGVAVVATARRDRDRARRASSRLLLSTLLAGGLVLLFGGLALRERARELQATQSLAQEQLAREREVRLDREGRAATVVTLASGVAHEIATPLGVIVGRAEQLRARAGGDERAVKAAQAIIDQAEGIREVIRGFLGLARGGAPALRSLRPKELADTALLLVEHRFTDAGVALSSRIPEDLPPIAGDARLLAHALVNLLLNACDACARGGAVELRAESREGAVAFVVADDGHGIPDVIAARVTEPFFTTKAKGRGTGLGLAIANEIVKTHRGSLAIGRGDPRGTRVSIEIPLARLATEDA